MAFGDLKWCDGGGATTIPTGGLMVASMSHSVSVGDLICVLVVEESSSSTTSVYDNLGQTYTAQDSGGFEHLKTYWYVATTSGTITAINAQGTSSSHDWALCAACFAGPFASSPLDKTPGIVDDFSGPPWTSSATGTLSQADELIVDFCGIQSSSVGITATSPNLLAGSFWSTFNAYSATIGYQVVSSTSTVTPEFAGGSGLIASLSTISFKKGTAVASGSLTATLGALTTTATSKAIASGSLTKTLNTLTVTAAGKVLFSGSLAKTLDALTVSGAGNVVVSGSVNKTLEDLVVVDDAGIVVSGMLDQVLADLTTLVEVDIVASGVLDTTLNTLTVSASGTVHVSGVLAQTLESITLTIHARVVPLFRIMQMRNQVFRTARTAHERMEVAE